MLLFLVTPCLVVPVQPCMEWMKIKKKKLPKINFRSIPLERQCLSFPRKDKDKCWNLIRKYWNYSRLLFTESCFFIHVWKIKCLNYPGWKRQEKGTKTSFNDDQMKPTTFSKAKPAIIIGQSNFDIRKVFLSPKMPRNVCGCIYHSNIILLLKELHWKFPEHFPLYREEFIKACVYDPTLDSCMSCHIWFV